MEEAIFEYGLLSDTDKKFINELIFRLLPKDDEPITAEDLAAMREAKAEVMRGEVSRL